MRYLFDLDGTLIQSCRMEDAVFHLLLNLTMDVDEAREVFSAMKFARCWRRSSNALT
ncbi:MAG: hypothetical protein ACLVJX_09710 [Merdibacter sp.]